MAYHVQHDARSLQLQLVDFDRILHATLALKV